MTLPWRSDTTEDIAAEADSRYETPGGAQNKADQAFNEMKTIVDLAIITGDSGPEAATARYSTPYGVTYPILKDRLDAADQISITTKSKVGDIDEHVAKSIVPENYSGAVVTFVDDDGYSQFLSRWKPIADSKGIVLDIGVNSAYLGQTDSKGTHMTLAQLNSLYAEGFGIVSHTNTHGNFNDYTPEQLDTELKNSLAWIVDNGFGKEENVLIYPFGITSNQVNIKNATRKYFNYGISVNDDINPPIVDNMCVNRIHGDLRDLQGLKDAVDYANSQNTWMVVLTHSWDDTYWSTSKMTSLVDYIQGLGIPILKSNDAIKLKGNAVAFGEYTDQVNRSVYVNRNGVNNIGIKVVGDAFTYTSESPITLFEQGKITVVPLFTTQDLLLGVGGVMEIHRIPPNDDFSYSVFKPATRNELYYNKWNTISNVWNGWVRMATPTSHIVNNNVAIVLMDDLISTYAPDCETIVPLVSAKDTLLGVGGVMKVFRSTLTNFSYATYTPYNVNSLYMRKWLDGSNTWGIWTKISV